MCGIAGFVAPMAIERARDRLREMCEVIAHRGPDENDTYHQASVHLGHQRLSIIDLAAGQQPMRSSDTGNVIVFNGEIYNHEELREELEARGVGFETKSDTEVLLKGFDCFGLEVVSMLRGMFAFALWQPGERRMILVRDRVGIKPLYWSLDNRRLVFGSELKAVMASGFIKSEIDPAAVDDYFAHGFIRSPRTIYCSVSKLPPGTMAVFNVDMEGHAEFVRSQRYWQLPEPSDEQWDYQEAKQALVEKLEDAVRVRLMSEVPLGAFLSGGIDSSTVVWLMSRNQSQPVKTFSMAFEESGYDESHVARAVADHFGTEHHEELVHPSAIEALPAVVASHDEPFGDPSAIPTWYLSQMARRDVTVCLSGDGGDELLAGYSRYFTIAHELAGGVSKWQRFASSVARLLNRPESRAVNKADRLGLPMEQYYARFRAIYSEDMRRELLSSAMTADVKQAGTAALFERLSSAQQAVDDPVLLAQMCDFNVYLPDDVLAKVDRASMAHSLEARVPLLDHEVVEFIQRLPAEFKYGPTASGEIQGKRILRDIIRDALPPEVLNHPKQGFSVPLSRWFRGELADLLAHMLSNDGPLHQSGWFNIDYARKLSRLHQNAKLDLDWQLWQLVVFAQWLETHPASLG